MTLERANIQQKNNFYITFYIIKSIIAKKTLHLIYVSLFLYNFAK